MTKPLFNIELDHEGIEAADFEKIKPQLVKEIVKDAWLESDDALKLEFSKHMKVKVEIREIPGLDERVISTPIGKYALDAAKFDEASKVIERIEINVNKL